MNKSAIKHIPKSQMAYPINSDNLHIYIQTAKDDATSIQLIYGDPFDYDVIDGKYIWNGITKPLINLKKSYSTEFLDHWFCEVETINKRTKYAFLISDENKTYFYGSRRFFEVKSKEDKRVHNLLEFFNFPYINEEDLIDSPSWVKDTVWYLIFPERFNRSKDSKGDFIPWNSVTKDVSNSLLFGGDIQGIIEKIPYLKNLGVTGIYFTPIFEAYSAHKYDTIDYFKIDPQFGTNKDFKDLVTICHQSNIKVMLDAVFNHCGWFHPFFQDVLKNKKQSPYWDCFYIDNEEFINFEINEKGLPIKDPNYRPKFRTFAMTPMMPKLKTSNKIIEDYLLNVAKYWVKEFDIDGWRLDVSNEVSHSFWRKFKNEVRSIKDDIYIIGENWDDSNAWLRGDQFDAVMNYELSFATWQFFSLNEVNSKIDSKTFSYLINDIIVKYPKNIAENMFNLVGSHDTMRMLSRCKGNKDILKLAYLFIFSFCGSPTIYYGDEIGLEGEHDPDCRRCMIWESDKQDLELFSFFQKLINFRNKYEDFKQVDLTWINNENNLIAYQKGKLIFIINNNNKDMEITLNKTLENIETGKTEDYNTLRIGPYQYFILKVVDLFRT